MGARNRSSKPEGKEAKSRKKARANSPDADNSSKGDKSAKLPQENQPVPTLAINPSANVVPSGFPSHLSIPQPSMGMAQPNMTQQPNMAMWPNQFQMMMNTLQNNMKLQQQKIQTMQPAPTSESSMASPRPLTMKPQADLVPKPDPVPVASANPALSAEKDPQSSSKASTDDPMTQGQMKGLKQQITQLNTKLTGSVGKLLSAVTELTAKTEHEFEEIRSLITSISADQLPPDAESRVLNELRGLKCTVGAIAASGSGGGMAQNSYGGFGGDTGANANGNNEVVEQQRRTIEMQQETMKQQAQTIKMQLEMMAQQQELFKEQLKDYKEAIPSSRGKSHSSKNK
mmetsp:Transcript_10165/g.18044  ORF Transcript_10165/g.18044 Transcript_10165/m.18044 type:complete len:343 (-) Transcript_10165:135-1163(-)